MVRRTHPKERYVLTKIEEEIVYAKSLSSDISLTWEFWKKDIMKEKIK